MSEAKPTLGEWEAWTGAAKFGITGPAAAASMVATSAIRQSGFGHFVDLASSSQECPGIALGDTKERAIANANLFADAGNTYNTTGLTPSQLVERAKELEEALSKLAKSYERVMQLGAPPPDALKAARAALSKARPNTAEPQGVAYALPDFDTVEQHIYGACRRYITQDMLEPIHNLIREAVDADRASNGGAPAGAAREPTAFVHWPIDGPPRLVWYSQKALNDAILKTYEGHQPDVKLYTAQAAPAAAKEPSP